MSINLSEQLISMPTNRLLAEFGAGNHVPGAGSAAALSGMLACKLCLTVIKLTKKKKSYSSVWLQIGLIELEIVETLEPILDQAFQKDTKVFDEVIIARLERDREDDTERRKQLSDIARSHLREATEIPLNICEACHRVSEHAISLFDIGYKSARGDSGAAASIAISGAISALLICYLNLKDFKGDELADVIRQKYDALLQRSKILQGELSLRINRLRKESIRSNDTQIQLGFENKLLEMTKTKIDVNSTSSKPGSAEVLSLFPEEASKEKEEVIKFAARTTSSNSIEEPQIQIPQRISENFQSAGQSEEEVFAEIFGKRIAGKNKAWFEGLRDFFIEKDLGDFASRVDFLVFLKRTLDIHHYRSPRIFNSHNLLTWYKEFDAGERSEGTKL
jgi:formiminotetrahydrofolate cyclodeaminase